MSEQEPSLRYRDPIDARGFVILSGAVLVDRELSDGAKITYLLLLDYARQDEACWPGQATLAAERGIKERAIRNHLTELEQRGLITIEQRGLRKTNVYWIENVQRVYGQLESKRPFDRQKNAGLDRQYSAGQERQKNADKEDAVGNIHKRKKETLNAREEVIEALREERSTSNESEKGINTARDRAVQKVVTLTRDEGSHRRFEQLWEIAEGKNALDAWSAALRATQRRMNTSGKEPLERPGAYFDRICIKELEKREIFVPTSAEKLAERDVGDIIRQGLFDARIDEPPISKPAEQAQKAEPSLRHAPKTPEQLDAELAYLEREGGAALEKFETFVAVQRESYQVELAGMGATARERLLAAFDRSEKRRDLFRKWQEADS